MDASAEDRRDALVDLVTLVPVFLAPLALWLALRVRRSVVDAPSEARVRRALLARRLVLLALVDAVIAVVVGAAKLLAPPHPPEPWMRPQALEPTSPFEPFLHVDCADVWREQALAAWWPVALGCIVIAAGWWRARVKEPGHRGRWGLVVVPLALAPLVGIGASQAACVACGGWSTGAALLGVLAQGVAMLAGGLVAMAFARDELQLVLGPRLPLARTTGLAALYLLSGLARVALLVFALWSLSPELHVVRDSGVEAILAGEHGASGRALVLVAAVAIAPPAEELLFRGLLLPGLAHGLSPRLALLVSAAVFGLFHVPSHGIAAILPGILGVAFGWARLRSGGLAAPIALHVANNLVVTLLTWASL